MFFSCIHTSTSSNPSWIRHCLKFNFPPLVYINVHESILLSPACSLNENCKTLEQPLMPFFSKLQHQTSNSFSEEVTAFKCDRANGSRDARKTTEGGGECLPHWPNRVNRHLSIPTYMYSMKHMFPPFFDISFIFTYDQFLVTVS